MSPPPVSDDDWASTSAFQEHDGLNRSQSDTPADANSHDTANVDYSYLMNYAEEPDYYALLGLSRSPPPTEAEIRAAYRNLTLAFHPDKQPPNLRGAAEAQFNRIQEAYETLIDVKKRTVYDLLGAEGVRQEWAPGGAMSSAREAQRRQLGVRAQTPQEFRKWFLDTMKTRERKALNSLVQSKGSITLGVNASPLFSMEDDETTSGRGHFGITAYTIGYNFRAPILIPRKLDNAPSDEEVPSEEEAQPQQENEPLEVLISASISGEIQRLSQQAEITHTDGTKETQMIPLPLILAAKDITLGATVSHPLGTISSIKGFRSPRLFTLLDDATISVTTLVLPTPAIQASFAKAYTLVPGTHPVNVNLNATLNRSIFKLPPTVELQVSKQIARRKHAWCSWNSGALYWPNVLIEFLQPFIGLGVDVQTALAVRSQYSKLSLGLLSLAEVPARTAALGDDNEKEEDDADRVANDNAGKNPAEAWQAQLDASPAGTHLSFSYSRNVFAGQAANEVPRSEWSSEGHYALPPASRNRSVRMEIQTTVGMDLSLAWSISGVRRVGDFSRLGLGIGLEGQNGLVMTLSWSRLGQKIKLPIAVCPLDSVDLDVATLAVVLSWGTYCAFEFGIVRPRERKRRRLMIAKRQKELKRSIPKKKAESDQAIELMTEQVRRRQAREERHCGLIITKAEYGYVLPAEKRNKASPSENRMIDVTIPVAALVDHGQLVIPKNMTKIQILGFYDPAPLLPKVLRIWYTFGGVQHYVEASDSDDITCPMRSHRCE